MSDINDGVLLAGKVVILVKFNFGEKNFALIPGGVTKVERLPDYDMDAKHAYAALQAGTPELGEVGLVREGRVDTAGSVAIETKRPTHAGLIRRGLTNNKHRLVGLHWFSRRKTDPRTKHESTTYVVCAAFRKTVTAEEVMAPTTDQTEALRMLSRLTWAQCFVYDNPNGVVTVNFAGALVSIKGRPDAPKPKHAIAVRNSRIVAVDVIDTMDESLE